jgi:hypothetical protein
MKQSELNGFVEAVREVVREELKPVERRLDGMDKRLDEIPAMVIAEIENRVPGLVVDVISQRFPNLFPHS